MPTDFYISGLCIRRKKRLLDPSEIGFFQNHLSQMAALDYYVSLESDIFVPTYDVNMAGVFEGDRSRSIEDNESSTIKNYISNSSSQEDSPKRNNDLLMVLGSPLVLGSNTSNTWIPTAAKTKTTELMTFALAFEAALDNFWSKLPS